jgi:hypothetical protein
MARERDWSQRMKVEREEIDGERRNWSVSQRRRRVCFFLRGSASGFYWYFLEDDFERSDPGVLGACPHERKRLGNE